MAAADQRYTDIEIQPLTRDSECGYCCLKLIEIEEPRVLPCGHIQCTQCIVVDSQNPEIVCKVCRKEYSDISIPSLPKVSQHIIEDALVPVSQRCDLCDGRPVKATRCCADCKKKLCDTHCSEHEWHVSNHELKLLEDGLAPERYEVQRCDKHENQILNDICKNCMMLFCKRCDTKDLCHNTGDCRDGVGLPGVLKKAEVTHEARLETADHVSSTIVECQACSEKIHRNKKGKLPKKCPWCNQKLTPVEVTAHIEQREDAANPDNDMRAHEVVPLREVTDDLREMMRSLSQQLYDKMKRCRNLEKTTWRRLSDLEEHVQKLSNAVEDIAYEIVLKINHLRDDIISDLQTYVTEASAQVEKYSEERLISVTVLDDQFRHCQDLAVRTSDKKLLEEFSQAESQLTQAAGDMTLERVLPLKRPYLSRPTGILKVDMCTKVIREPTGLDFIRKKKTSDGCLGVSWTDDGRRVLCAMTGGLEARGDDGELIRKVDIADPQHTYSAHLMTDRLYTQLCSSTTKKYLTYVGSLDEPLQTLLHEVEYEKGRIHHISVSHNRLAIIDRVNKELRICTTDGTHMYNIKLKDMIDPYGVELLPAANSVLVTDYEGNLLRKYRLEFDSEPVWTCPGLKEPSGVTTDESELIYVTSMDGNIYLISPQGEKIRELNHPMLKESVDKKNWIHDISVSDGRMVVACRGEGVMYFNLL